MYFLREGIEQFDSKEHENDFNDAAKIEWSLIFYEDPQQILDATPEELIEKYSSVEVNPEDLSESKEYSDGKAGVFYEGVQTQFGQAFPFIPKNGITYVMYAYPMLELEHITLSMLAKYGSGDLIAGEREKELIRLAYDAGKIIEKISMMIDEDKNKDEFEVVANQLFEMLESQLGERKAGYLMNVFFGNNDEYDS